MQKNYKGIILLLLSIISCGIAQGLTIIAIPWYFTDYLNSSSEFSFGYALITFLGLFWGLYAGVMIDRINRKHILLYINIISACFFMAIGISEYIFNSYNSVLFFLGFGICSFYYMIFFPNLYALAQELTSEQEYIKINSFIEIFFQTTSISAAIICGLLLSGSNNFLQYFNWTLFEFKSLEVYYLFEVI